MYVFSMIACWVFVEICVLKFLFCDDDDTVFERIQ